MSLNDKLTLKLNELKLSPAGKAWLHQALYPPGQVTKTAIPDQSIRASLRVDYRPATTIAKPVGVTSTTWDCYIWSPPGDSTAVVIASGPAGVSFTDVGKPAQATARVLRFIDKPFVIENGRAANFTVASPSVGSVTTLGVNTDPMEAIRARLSYKSVTVHITASDLYNGGVVTSAQFDAGYTPSVGFVPIPVGGGSLGYVRTGCTMLTSVPLLTNTVPGTRISEAKHGVYIPQRHTAFSNEFPARCLGDGRSYANATSLTVISGDTANDASSMRPLGLLPTDERVAAINGPPWWLSEVATAGTLWDMSYSDMTTGVALFQGLHEDATLSLQCYAGVEYLLEENSAFVSMIENSPEVDSAALEAYNHIAMGLNMTYEARANSLGLALTAAANAARFIAPHLWAFAKPLLATAVPMLAQKILGSQPPLANPSPNPSGPRPRVGAPKQSQQRNPAKTRPRRAASAQRPKLVAFRPRGRSRSARN